VALHKKHKALPGKNKSECRYSQKWAITFDNDLVTGTQLESWELACKHIRLQVDLVCSWLNSRSREEKVEVLLIKIGDTNTTREPSVYEGLHLLPCGGNVRFREDRMVDQVQVNIGSTKLKMGIRVSSG
jgi:hypothetical protein